MNCFKIIFRCPKINLNAKYLLNFTTPRIFQFQHHYCTAAVHQEPALSTNQNDIPYYNKIIYSEVLKKIKIPKQKKEEGPIFLKYVLDNEDNKEKEESSEIEEEEKAVFFPYEIKKKFLNASDEEKHLAEHFPEEVLKLTPMDNTKIKIPKWSRSSPKFRRTDIIDPKLLNDESEDEIDELNELVNIDDINSLLNFGTCDPTVPVSSVPCGGCGAFLQCNDMSIPGFLSKEDFIEQDENILRSKVCQRCQFLNEFNVALGVNVSPDEYPKIIESINTKNVLVLLMVDLLDFPCSIWPGLANLIGSNPIVVLGNKIDLFIQEGPDFLSHIRNCLIDSLQENEIDMRNVKDVRLISAKTGYGIEELITKLYTFWGNKGDVYLIGCTNAGKSTLFNSLIQSDYCKVKATEMMHRATISSWPGTTLNLLRFPIQRHGGNKYALRNQRLLDLNKKESAKRKMMQKNYNIRFEQIPLKGYVTQTKMPEKDDQEDFFSSDLESSIEGLNPEHPQLQGKWFYDTPGVVNHDQIINFLTTPELLLTVPKKMLIPRNFLLEPKTSLFIGGLARLDYVSGPKSEWFTVYASMDLPVTITKLGDADLIYNRFIGTRLFGVPSGGKERMDKWPKLLSKDLSVSGRTEGEASGDIVLSSAGWVAVAPLPAHRCHITAWTPEGRGIYLRKESVIKQGHKFRGGRITGTPAFKVVMRELEGNVAYC